MTDFHELEGYYKDISSHLVCDRKQKKAFISDFRSCVEDYASDNPECTAEEIKAVFGSAVDIAITFDGQTDSVRTKRSAGLKRTVAVTAAAALLIWLGFAIFSLIDVHEEAHGTLSEILMFIEMTEENI